ncbi:MAG: hypothetical protein VKL98_06985 [Cyanobacteriota bacterium]|nr:hypothetical protein [Cyanobacteriota bacterium]
MLSISILVLMVLTGTSIRDNSGEPALPATVFIVEMASLVMNFLAPLLIIFLAGDLVWREREVRVDPLTDPLPVRSWALVLGKLLALALILGCVLVLLTVGGLLTQTLQQYTHYDLGVYAVGLFTLVLVDLLLISILAITIQVLVNQKFLGYFLSAALVILFSQGDGLFRSARLFQYGYKPDAIYSPMSGYGGMLAAVRFYQGYWLAIALLLLCLSTLFWVRGVDTQPKPRWRIARQRFTRPMQTVMGLSALTAVLLGGWIFYHTHLLHPAPSRAQVTDQGIAYEKAYGRLIDAQPKITAMDLQGDLYPDEDGRFALKGTYTLENKTPQPIDTILLNLPKRIQVKQYADAPPYPSATDLVAALRQVTPEKYQYLITDLFETVTLYNNRVTAATVTQRADGKFDVTLRVNTAKVRSDDVGNETPATMTQEDIDVGLFDATGKLIYLKKHPFSDGETELTLTVDTPPQSAGIDPLHKMIDKVPDDNRVGVSDGG